MSKQLFESLISEINSGNLDKVSDQIANLSEEELDRLFSEAQPYKALGTASTDKFVLASVSNMREKYLKKLIITAMVSFLFQMKEEFATDEEDLVSPPNKEDFMEETSSQVSDNFNPEVVYNEQLVALYKERNPTYAGKKLLKDMENELSEDDLLLVSTKANQIVESLKKKERKLNSAKYHDALETSIKQQSDSERKIINRFLSWLFKFDENKHEQEGQNDIEDDEERIDAKTLKGISYENIPPNDTHCRFNAYLDLNYEKMREATQNIYNVKPDLEHAMIVYDVVDTQQQVDDFIHKYGANSKYDILSFGLNRWTLLGPFKENRQRVDYYNKHNSIIKSMLDQQEKDAALGEDLMKKRVKTVKKKSERVFGKDDSKLKDYLTMNPNELETKFNAKIEEVEEDKVKLTREVVIDQDTGRELEVDEEGVPTDALEIPIISVNARTGETNKTRIFSKAE